MVRRPVLDPQQLFTDLRLVVGIAVLEVAADHVADDAVFRDVGLGDRLDRLAVAEDRDGVGDLLDLVQLVADDDRRDPLLAEAQDQVEQMVGVVVVESGGRLVEDEELDLFRQGLRDLDQLLLSDADLIDGRGRVLVEADALEQLARLEVGLVPVDEAAGALALIVEEDVLGDRQVGAEGELLMDDDDALRLAVAEALELHLVAHEDDVAVVGAVRVDPRQHLHEGGFAGAVLAADGVDLAALDREVHVRERLDAGEGLGDVAHLENDLAHVRRLPREGLTGGA